MANANIFQQYLQAPRSVADYSADLDKKEAAGLALEGQRRQNALQALAMDQQVNKQNALQRYASGWTAQTTADQRISDLRGNAYTQAEADAMEKAYIERQKGQASADKDRAETDGKTFDNRQAKFKAAVQQVANFTDPTHASSDLDAAVQGGSIPAPVADAIRRTIPTDPSKFDAWKLRLIVGLNDPAKMAELLKPLIQTNNTGGATVTQAIDPMTGRVINTSSIKNTQSPDSDASTRLGYARLNEDRRHNTASEGQGKVPAGYRQLPDGNLQAIPGGPADLKQIGTLNADTQALTGSISGFDRLATAANEVLNHPGLKGITGWRGSLPNSPGSDAANAQALLGTLKSQVGFGVLQDMRNNSKTGGALGGISNEEGRRLEENLAALDKAQSLDQFQSSLKKIIDYAEQAKGRVREAYNLKHGNRAVQPSSDHPPAISDLLKKYGG